MAHLAAIAVVCLLVLAEQVCPLTILENRVREQAGGTPYPGDFIAYWVEYYLYYNAPGWVFKILYLSFGALVAWTYWRYPPGRRWRR